jgi:peptidyl-prolyl cis-trans isomerase SurA
MVLAAGALVLGAVALPACSASNASRQSTPAVALAPEESSRATDNSVTRTPSGKTIPILVNDVPITQYDIQQRVRLMRLGGGKGGTQQAADELINETLQALEAQRRGISIPDGPVDEAYASIARRLDLSPTQLTAALGSEGIEAASLKKRLRAQMIWQNLVQQRTQMKASIRTEEVTAALLQKGDPNAMTVTEYMLQQIVFVVPQGSSSSLYSQRRREAEAFRQRYQGCETALEQARQLRGVVVKDIGRRNSGQLSGPEGEAIKKTAAGKTAPPTQTDEGIELIAVCSTKNIQSTAIARAEIENELYLEQANNLGADYLKELRDRAIIEYR